ncbi:MAG: YbhB/YbcL family Raf kinase inhibitor-like protein [Hyphomicrobiales bacterium]|nr:YbhB/YbcL family Raf kinase inhibitor-like protein [Hyphomicrobiales bacterium]MCP5371868.1 YbhB/YbcL family Raf kinase inhibitor-like protein [Hyphomicrobiales bacterium]
MFAKLSAFSAAVFVAWAVLGPGAAGPARADGFTVSSPDFQDGDYLKNAHVFAGFGCTGGNESPALAWSGAPAGTKSFAVTAYDPDAPTGSGWWHWVVVNLPATATGLGRGVGKDGMAALPAGALQVRTDFGAPGYGGPCPPQGDHPHRYLFKVHALKVEKLDVAAESSPALVGFFLHFNTLATAELMGLYKR